MRFVTPAAREVLVASLAVVSGCCTVFRTVKSSPCDQEPAYEVHGYVITGTSSPTAREIALRSLTLRKCIWTTRPGKDGHFVTKLPPGEYEAFPVGSDCRQPIENFEVHPDRENSVVIGIKDMDDEILLTETLGVPRGRPTGRCSRTVASVASLPLAPAAERQ